MKTKKKMLLGAGMLIFIAVIALLVSLGVPGRDRGSEEGKGETSGYTPGVEETFISGHANSVSTNVFIENNTSRDYGLVGIKSIKTIIMGRDIKIHSYKKILRYNSQGGLELYREFLSEFNRRRGRWVLTNSTVSTVSVTEPVHGLHAANLRPAGTGDPFANRYDAQVSTAWLPEEADCTVEIVVSTVDGVGVPMNQEVARIRNRFKFILIE